MHGPVLCLKLTAFLNIPQPQSMIFRDRQQKIRIFWVKLQLVDGVTVTHKMPEK